MPKEIEGNERCRQGVRRGFTAQARAPKQTDPFPTMTSPSSSIAEPETSEDICIGSRPTSKSKFSANGGFGRPTASMGR